MPAWLSNIDWIFYSLAVLLGCGAAWLLHRGVSKDSARGKRRCPRCWYDLTGIGAKAGGTTTNETPRWTCPECGHETADERQLLKTRRNWRRVAGSVFLAVCCYAAAFAPRGIETGWTGFVPTTVLMYVAQPESSLYLSNGMPAPRWMRMKAELTAAMWDRVDRNKASRWQSSVFLHRVLAKYPLDPEDFYRLPTCWMKDQEIRISVGYQQSSWGDLGAANRFTVEVTLPDGRSCLLDRKNGQWSGGSRIRLGTAETSMIMPIVLRTLFTPIAGGEPIELAKRTVEEQIRVRTSSAEAMFPEDSAQINARIQQLLAPRLLVTEGEIALVLGDRRDSPKWNRTRMFGACTFTLRSQGQIIASGKLRGWSDYPVWKDWQEVPVTFGPGADAIVRSGAAIEAEFVGDPVASYERYAVDPFAVSFDAAWTGRFTCTLPIVTKAESPQESTGEGTDAKRRSD